MIKAWKVVLDLECIWRMTVRDYENYYEKKAMLLQYSFVAYYSECLLGVLSVFVGVFPRGRKAGNSTVV